MFLHIIKVSVVVVQILSNHKSVCVVAEGRYNQDIFINIIDFMNYIAYMRKMRIYSFNTVKENFITSCLFSH